uniref:Uncharacterized protein n=1 Tax=Gigaspora margarita TaxID=4874 RepID=A0A8H3WVV1_GIGMA
MNTNFDYSDSWTQDFKICAKNTTNKKIWDVRDRIASLKERKRIRANEHDKVAVKGVLPNITSNIRDPTQSEPNKQQTLEIQEEEPSSGMVLRKQKKGFYDKSSDSDDYVKVSH